jgi:predicted PurR-regulated permease PerM
VGTLLFLLWFGYVLRGVFTPVLIGLGLAYVFNPVITARQMRWRVPRIVSTSVLVIAIFIVVAGFIAWFGPLTVQQAQTLAKRTPQYVQSLSTRYGIQLGDLSTPLEAFASKLQNNPMSILHSLLAGTRQAFGMIGATTEFALVMVLVPIYFFFAWQFDRISRPFASCRPVRGSAFFKFCAAWIMRSADFSAAGFLSGC